jgi:hypothetical protein
MRLFQPFISFNLIALLTYIDENLSNNWHPTGAGQKEVNGFIKSVASAVVQRGVNCHRVGRNDLVVHHLVALLEWHVLMCTLLSLITVVMCLWYYF